MVVVVLVMLLVLEKEQDSARANWKHKERKKETKELARGETTNGENVIAHANIAMCFGVVRSGSGDPYKRLM